MKALLAAAVAALSLTACGGGNPPCETLPPPSDVEQKAAAAGAEVEREVEGGYSGEAECVVVGDRWVDQTDDA